MRHMLFKQRQKPSQPVRSKELANIFKASLRTEKSWAAASESTTSSYAFCACILNCLPIPCHIMLADQAVSGHVPVADI